MCPFRRRGVVRYTPCRGGIEACGAFARVIDLGRLRVAFSVPEHEVGLLPVGTTAKAVIPALDDKEFALRVSDKSLVANPLGHTYKVYGTMLTQGSSAINSAGMLPDMVAKVKVDIDTKAGIVVPGRLPWLSGLPR